MLYPTRFVIKGKKEPKALLYRNEAKPHPALKYRKVRSMQTSAIVSKLEDLLREIRNIGRVRSHEIEELASLVTRFEKAADVIERRFRQAWRNSNDMPTGLVGSATALRQ
jgi:hypothetical protein